MTCPLDKGATNWYCTGNQPVCPGNRTTWADTIIQNVTLVRAFHVIELETAINNERTHVLRRDASPACPTNCSDMYSFVGARGVGDIVYAFHFMNIDEANDTTQFADPSSLNVWPGKIIEKSDIDELRRAINETEYNCICNSHCTCFYDCGCDGECPTDGYYYY